MGVNSVLISTLRDVQKYHQIEQTATEQRLMDTVLRYYLVGRWKRGCYLHFLCLLFSLFSDVADVEGEVSAVTGLATHDLRIDRIDL